MEKVRKVSTKTKDGVDVNWRVEEIENGYLVTKEWEEKEKGKDWGDWKSKKYFTEKNPLEGFKPDMDIIEESVKTK